MKTKEELNAIKEEVENVNKKLAELTEEELKQVVGGYDIITTPYDPTTLTSDPTTIQEFPGGLGLTCFESQPCWGLSPEMDCKSCDQYQNCRNTKKGSNY